MSQNNSTPIGDSTDKLKKIDGAFGSTDVCVPTVVPVENHCSAKHYTCSICPPTSEDASSDEEFENDAPVSSLQGGDDNRVAAATSTAQKENKKRTLDQFVDDPEFQAEVKACADTFKKAKRETKEINALAERIAKLGCIAGKKMDQLAHQGGKALMSLILQKF